MKKRLTRGEKWLFAASLLFLVGVAFWQRQKTAPYSLKVSGAYVDAVQFSPDSQRLVVFATTNRSVGEIFDLKSQRKVCDLAKPKDLSGEWDDITYDGPDWSPDGRQIAGGVFSVGGTQSVSSVYRARTITLWDAQNGAVLLNQRCQSPSYLRREEFIHYDASGKTLIGGGVPPARYDAATLKLLNQPNPAFNQDLLTYSNVKLGLAAVYNMGGNGVRVCDLKTKKVVWQTAFDETADFTWAGDILCVYNIASKKDPKTGQKIKQNYLLLWDGKTRRLMPSPPFAPVKVICDYDFNPNKPALALFVNRSFTHGKKTRNKGELMVWDYHAKRLLWSKPMETPLNNLAWSPDGTKLAATAPINYYKRHLFVFDQYGQLRFEKNPSGGNITWSPDSQQLATVVTKPEKEYQLSNTLEIHRFED